MRLGVNVGRLGTLRRRGSLKLWKFFLWDVLEGNLEDARELLASEPSGFKVQGKEIFQTSKCVGGSGAKGGGERERGK